MQVRVATAGGLFDVDESGHLDCLIKGDVTHLGGSVAVIDGRSVVRIADGERLAESPLVVHCIASTAAGVLIGTAEARLFSVDHAPTSALEPDQSFDAIPTRDAWYTPWGGPPDTRSIAVAAAGDVFVNVHVGGAWRGSDDRWHEVIDVDSDTHQVLADSQSGAVVVAAAVGFGQSTDGGRNFAWTTDGLHATYCRAVAVADDHVLVTASTGPFTKQRALYRRRLSHRDSPFQRVTDGLPEWFPFNVDTFQLAARGADAALGTEHGAVYVSSDAGASWERLADGLDPIRGVAVL